MPGFRFGVNEKHFENRGFRKLWRHDNHVSSLTEFMEHKSKMTSGDFCVFLISPPHCRRKAFPAFSE